MNKTNIPPLDLKHLLQVQNIINYTFKDTTLLTQAFTHPSLARFLDHNRKHLTYQRLEFIGDKVIGLTISGHLLKHHPYELEGDISKRHAALVNGQICAQIAKQHNLGLYVIMTNSERTNGGEVNTKILEDILEALIGAIYLDSDFPTAQTVIHTMWSQHLQHSDLPVPENTISILQELYQSKYKTLPNYVIEPLSIDQALKLGYKEDISKSMQSVFLAKITLSNGQTLQALGKSHKLAKTEVAKKVLELFNK